MDVSREGTSGLSFPLDAFSHHRMSSSNLCGKWLCLLAVPKGTFLFRGYFAVCLFFFLLVAELGEEPI